MHTCTCACALVNAGMHALQVPPSTGCAGLCFAAHIRSPDYQGRTSLIALALLYIGCNKGNKCGKRLCSEQAGLLAGMLPPVLSLLSAG
eukprot:scaffold219021_cov22-Tisochrysis_lutea.AAC.1